MLPFQKKPRNLSHLLARFNHDATVLADLEFRESINRAEIGKVRWQMVMQMTPDDDLREVLNTWLEEESLRRAEDLQNLQDTHNV